MVRHPRTNFVITDIVDGDRSKATVSYSRTEQRFQELLAVNPKMPTFLWYFPVVKVSSQRCIIAYREFSCEQPSDICKEDRLFSFLL